ncbi:MAG TPA: hypothetical protein VFV23_14205 [Verrucomicrobiae bacterium]|nr:hypothetical protein [Verrucomicrobiae bacterium]
MISPRLYILLLIALMVACFAMAAKLEPQFHEWRGSRADGDIFEITLGEGRALFANEFYVKADEYYHSGYYPSIFDNRENFQTPHIAEDTGAVASKNKGGEEEQGFRMRQLDWIDAFSRHFYPNRHTHLDQGGASGDLKDSGEIREILPWLKLSADLDPHNVQTYVVTGYWLRSRMHKPDEALAFLREGLRNNPDSYEILFELGCLYNEDLHDPGRARNVWELAVQKYLKLSAQDMKDNRLLMEKLGTQLGLLEEKEGNYPRAVYWLQLAKKASLTPESIQSMIDDIQKKMPENARTNSLPALPPQ